ncbi:hypothetical protein ASE67_02430 [Sphingomonas sp. Leaf23]|uniref:hypothetical protein n=1 Tax=Sphingomonas sp. Leaf23 TaxID=1735689 RepID=UPI000700C38A|nr:hypothetical protein [Sphingomonas sp. Leaf23]KQM88616.1 hypothetical protein ASE67_02430 [Sphingomonas sp. Leaf23]
MKQAIDQKLEQAVKDACNSPRFEQVLADAVRKRLQQPQFAFLWFIKDMQARLLREDPSMGSEKAFKMAAATYRLFLADEKTEFGDPRFDWSKAGAETLIEEYEIGEWERKA